MRLTAVVALALTAVVAGCSSDSGSGSDADVAAVATTTEVADLVRNVGGGRVDVHGVLSPGADPHGYEPRPSDAASIADAALVFKSGGEVDEWLDELVDNAGGDAEVVDLIDSVETIPGGHDEGETDPHWWQDPRDAQQAVAAIRDALIRGRPRRPPDLRAQRCGVFARASTAGRADRRLHREGAGRASASS